MKTCAVLSVVALAACSAGSSNGVDLAGPVGADLASSDLAKSPPVSCGALGSVVGVWQQISPPELAMPSNMETYSVATRTDGTVFAAGGNVTNQAQCPTGESCPPHGSGVLKSSDCGATWTVVSSSVPGSDGANLLKGGLWAMLVDQVEPDTMYVANGYGPNPTIYKSVNGGVDWTALNPDPTHALAQTTNFVQAIAIDPYNHAHLAVTFHDNCKAPHNVLCLSQSTDGGASWTVFDGPSSIPGWTISGWAEGASLSILGPSSYVFTATAGIWYTGDGGAHWNQLAGQYIMGSYAGTTHIAPDGTLFIGGNNIFTSPAAPGADPPFLVGTTHSVSAIAGSPGVNVIIDDGVNLYAGRTPTEIKQPFWTAPLANPTAWTKMPDQICGKLSCRGPNEMAYDANHHVIYSANWAAGLWRLVTR